MTDRVPEHESLEKHRMWFSRNVVIWVEHKKPIPLSEHFATHKEEHDDEPDDARGPQES